MIRVPRSKLFHAAALIALAAAAVAPTAAQSSREQIDGVANFGRVTERYFRGGKVTDVGVANLAKLGVRTIVDLRDEPTPGEAETAARLGISYVNIGMDGHATPDSATFDRILGLIKDADAPIYVHCSAGKHRAGTVCALYRMKVQGWSPERAWAEQQSYGFGAREEHPELYAFAYEGGYQGSASPDPIDQANASTQVPGAEAVKEITVKPQGVASAGSLSPTATYISEHDAVARAKASGGTGDILKIDLEYDVIRSIATWDVTFSSGLEYELDALTGRLLDTKTKAPAKIAVMEPHGRVSTDFRTVMASASKKSGRDVQEMELKHVKGTPQTIYEVVFVDGTTVVYDAASGKEIAGT